MRSDWEGVMNSSQKKKNILKMSMRRFSLRDGWIFNARKRVETMKMLTSCPDDEMMMNLVWFSFSFLFYVCIYIYLFVFIIFFMSFSLSLSVFLSFSVSRSPFMQNVLLDWEKWENGNKKKRNKKEMMMEMKKKQKKKKKKKGFDGKG